MDSHCLPQPPGCLSRTTTGYQGSNLWCPHRHSWVHWPSPDSLWRLPCDLCGDLWPTRICDKRCSGGAPDDPNATWPCCGGKVCAGGQFALDLWHHYCPILRCPDPEPLQFTWWHQSGLPYTPSWWAASSCPLSCVCLVCQKTARFHQSIFVTWNLFGSCFCFLYVNTTFRSGDKKRESVAQGPESGHYGRVSHNVLASALGEKHSVACSMEYLGVTAFWFCAVLVLYAGWWLWHIHIHISLRMTVKSPWVVLGGGEWLQQCRW